MVFKFLHTFIIQCWIASNRFGKFFIYPSCQYFLQGKIQFLLSWAILKILLMTAWVPQFNDVHTSSCFNRNNVRTTLQKISFFLMSLCSCRYIVFSEYSHCQRNDITSFLCRFAYLVMSLTMRKLKAPSTRIRLFLNPQLFLSGFKNFPVHA